MASVLSASGIAMRPSRLIGGRAGGVGAGGPPHRAQQAGLGQAEDPWVELAPARVGVVVGRPRRRVGLDRPLEPDEARRRPSARSSIQPGAEPANIAAPSAVDSLTTGTRTGTPSTSATICGHRLPLAAPPVNTISSNVAPGQLLDDREVAARRRRRPAPRSPGCTRRRFESRRAGRRRTRGTTGDAWTQRLASITFEKIAEHAVRARRARSAAASSMTTYASTPRRAASRDSRARRTRRGTSASRSRSRSRCPRSSTGPGTAWQSVRTRACGSMSGSSVHDRELPEAAARRASAGRAGRRRCRPARAACRRRRRRPACPRARPGLVGRRARVTAPTTVPGSSDLGHDIAATSPTSSSESGDHVRAREVEQVRARARRRVGHEPAGQPVQDPVAEHPDVGDRARTTSGSCSRIQRKRAGEVIDDPVAAALEDPPRVAAADELGGLGAGARVDVRAGPDLAARARRRGPCPRACSCC